MENIRKHFAKNNSIWVIVVMAGIVLINSLLSSETFIPYTLICFLIMLIFNIELINRYLVYKENTETKVRLVDYIKYQNFDMSKYFLDIKKKVTICTVTFILPYIGMYIIEKKILYLTGIVGIICASVVAFYYKKLSNLYLLNHRKNSTITMLSILSGIIYYIMKAVAVCVSAVLYSTIVYFLLVAAIIGTNDNVAEIMLLSKNMVVVYIVASLLFVMGAGIYNRKKANKLVPIFAIIMLVVTVVTTVIDVNNYVLVGENEIRIVSNGKKTTYEMSDITNCEIVCDESDFKVYVIMKDDRKIKVIGDVTETTDKWNENYRTDYMFASHLVDIVKTNGGSSVITGTDKYQKYLQTFDKECQEDFESLLKKVGE